MLEELTDFCGNVSFWDERLLLNSSWPHFTVCFQQTALVWIPTAYLCLTAPAYLFYLRHVTAEFPNKITGFNIIKLFLPLALCLLSVVQLLKYIADKRNEQPASLYMAYGLTAASFLYMALLVHLERIHGLVTSGIQFIYWLLVTLTNIIPLYTSVMQGEIDSDVFSFCLKMIQFVTVLVAFLLQFFSEAQADGYASIGQTELSPLLISSFPSQLLFWWTQKMMKVGFKKSLTSEDLFPLDPANQSGTVVPKFKRNWEKEKERTRLLDVKRLRKRMNNIQISQEEITDENIPLLSKRNKGMEYSPSVMKATSFTEIIQPSSERVNTFANSNKNNQVERRLPNHQDIDSPAIIQHTAEQSGRFRGENILGNTKISQKTSNKTMEKANPNSGTSNASNGTVILEALDGGIKKRPTSVRPSFKENGPGRSRKEDSSLTKKSGKAVRSSLLRALVATFWVPFLITQLLQLFYTLIQFVNPVVLRALLNYVGQRDKYKSWIGYVLACSFFISSLLSAILKHQAQYIVQSLGMRIRGAIINALYEKALTMSHESKKKATVGEIVNLMALDCPRIQDITEMLYIFWSGPLTVAIAIYQLWGVLEVASLAGLAVLLILVPVNGVIVSNLRRIQIATMFMKDRRIKLMNEVLNGIKVIKLYAWEKAFQDKIIALRNKELHNLKLAAIFQSGMGFMFNMSPYLVTLASFTTYILVSELGYLDPAKAFVSLSLFNLIRLPVNYFAGTIPAAVQAAVSLNRVNTFLSWADIDADNVKRDPQEKYALSIEKGTFTWDTTFPRATLQNINLIIPEGKLISIVGPVGCGKSSLLSAMLGEMTKLSGSVSVKSSIAYVSQEAWIQNATLRDNILFGNTLSQRRYKEVIKACALEPDLEILVGGDMTEIGEKGINLSGGQKQRVSLARAVYSNANTFLLDDPLSAVDSHVGKHIFHHVIGSHGVLAKKTRVLVTHGVQWLPLTDLVVVLNEGSISEIGSYEDLLSRDGAFAEFLKAHLAMEEETETEDEEDPEILEMKDRIRRQLSLTSSDVTSGDERKELSGSHQRLQLSRQRSRISESEKSVEAEKSKLKQKQKSVEAEKSKLKQKRDASVLVQEEQSMTGNVSSNVYLMYIKAVGGLSCLAICCCFVLYQAATFTSSIWLSQWTDDDTLANTSLAETTEYKDLNNKYLGVYGAFGCMQACFIACFLLTFNLRLLRASGNLHEAMLVTILKSPMSFFDTTPVGRIINRFSRDVDVADFNLPMSLRQTMIGSGNLITTIILISYSSPIFLTVIIPLAVIYKLLQKFYISSSRQLKRLESTTRSPVYTHFTETIQGATSIRAYGVTNRFILESQNRVDKNLICYYAYVVTQRWLGVRLELLGCLITLAAALFAVWNQDLSSGLVGLSVTYAMNVTGALNQQVMMSSELENNIVSVERLKEYADKETESAWKGPHYPSEGWPGEGEIQFNKYETRYRPGLDLVLRGLTCAIKGGEKVGIVGRTGAGKSSLTLALFRLIEAAGGSIQIDGETIANIGLHDLRGRLTILPQDAFVFSDTLRVNLDPIGEHTDDEIWEALNHSHLSSFVREVPGQLDYECGEGGQNLSVGQKQLICLTRSLLRKSKILVLDEATAAVDMETDVLIQQTIRSEFKDNTVLTIAHRLNTIMDYDKIMVLDQGNIKEFASPTELLSNPNGIFYGMAKAAGLA